MSPDIKWHRHFQVSVLFSFEMSRTHKTESCSTKTNAEEKKYTFPNFSKNNINSSCYKVNVIVFLP